MQKLEQVLRFNLGLTGDLDSPFCQHFDIFSDPNRLIPYRSTEADVATSVNGTDLKQYNVQNFQLGKDGKLYGLGDNLSGKPKVFSKADPTTGLWTKEATAEGSAALIRGCFIEWAGAWWMFSGTANVSKWTIGGTFTDVVATLGTTIATVAQGLVHSDELYLFYNNRVVRVSNTGTVTDNVLQGLPSNMRITSVCNWGTYIAIGMAYGTSATSIPSGVSKVFIWDTNTSTDVSDVIDWGEGALMVLGNIEGRLVGVSDKYLSSPLGVGNGSMVVRMWSGGTPLVYKEIVANQIVTLGRFIRDVVVRDNKMYWVASVPFGASTATESTFHLGIWSFGRKDRNADFSLSLDYVEEGIDAANFKINSFGNAGNYWFINHSADGSVSKTDDAANFNNTSVYEKVFGNGKQTSKIVGISAMFDPLPAAGQVALKYKKDEETVYTTISVFNTDNALRHSAVNIENLAAGGDTVAISIATPGVVTLANHLLVAGQKIRFSTTGALPTGITAGIDYYVLAASLTANTFRFSDSVGGAAINTSGTQSGVHTMDRKVELPQYKKIRIRLESTGGAVITGLTFVREDVPDDAY